MSQFLISELEHQRGRLDYYLQKKQLAEAAPLINTDPVQASKKAAPGKSTPATYDTWIEIYAERVKKIENQIVKLGLMDRDEVKAIQGAKTVH